MSGYPPEPNDNQVYPPSSDDFPNTYRPLYEEGPVYPPAIGYAHPHVPNPHHYPPPVHDVVYNDDPPYSYNGHGQPPMEMKPLRPPPYGVEDIPDGDDDRPMKDRPLHSPDRPPGREQWDQDDTSKDNPSLFFNDGIRRIDFILAYNDEDEKKSEKRHIFEENIKRNNLDIETEDKSFSTDGKTYFVKVHAPWQTLLQNAEMAALRMPIQVNDIQKEDTLCDKLLGCINMANVFELNSEYIDEEPDYFTATFQVSKLDRFIIPDDNKDRFFTNAERSYIVFTVLQRIKYGDERSRVGVMRMLGNGCYTGAFPLHDGKQSSDVPMKKEGLENERRLLYEEWARPGRFYKSQPLDLIRKYFGSKVAIYFAWLGFYTQALIPVSIIGFLAFLYGCATVFDDPVGQEVCNGAVGDEVMCPLCDQACNFYYVKDSCDYKRASYLFDNDATVVFAIIMAIWATLFLEFWKRRQNEIDFEWDLFGFEDDEEPVRPDYEAKSLFTKLNPVTQLLDPYIPKIVRAPRIAASLSTLLFLIFVVLAAVFGVIVYRTIIRKHLVSSDIDVIRNYSSIVTSVTASALNLIIIMVMSLVYERLAIFLTNLETPRTDTEYEDSFTFKMFLFQFVNYYSSLFYIALFKGKAVGYPGHYNTIAGSRQEECDIGGCLMELSIQLIIIMLGKQTINNFMEIFLPLAKNWHRQLKLKKQEEQQEEAPTQWEKDYELEQPKFLPLFYEYLEMVIQFGFVTLFVTAFPLAPVFAFLNNIIEIRLDAYKFVTQVRRPVGFRAQDIGAWYGILEAVAIMAVICNGVVLAFTSEFIPRAIYRHAVSDDSTLYGYMNWTLSYYNISQLTTSEAPDPDLVDMSEFNETTYCRYRDYRQPPWASEPYDKTIIWYTILIIRLSFIILFEHVAFFVKFLTAYLVPDMPGDITEAMKREQYVTREIMFKDTQADPEYEGADQHDGVRYRGSGERMDDRQAAV